MATISEDNRLFKPTVASSPKFTGERINQVVPKHPVIVPDNSLNPINSSTTDSPSRHRTDSPKRNAYYRDFCSTSVLDALRGHSDEASSTPIRRGSSQQAISPAAQQQQQQPAASLGSTPGTRQQNTSGSIQRTPDVAVSAARGRSRTPDRAVKDASGIARYSRMNQQSQEDTMRAGLWLAKPMADGRRYSQTRKRCQTPEQRLSDGTESPGRVGKRQIVRPDSMEGCSLTVTKGSENRTITPHRIARRADSPKAATRTPYRTDDVARDGSPDKSNRHSGLLGYGATGKKRLSAPDTQNLLDHTESSWRYEKTNRGKQAVAGRSHISKDPTNLSRYAPEECEKQFKPSVIVMDGPPAFVPSPRRARSPRTRGVGAPPSSEIFTMGDAPNVPFPHSEMPALSRSIGTFSPLRQTPPNRR